MNEIPDPSSESKRTANGHYDSHLLRALMDNLPDNIYFKDLQSRFTAVNRSMALWFGFDDPAELIGKTDFDLFSEEHARAALDNEERIIRTGEAVVGIEEKETWPDGHETWVSTSKMPLRDGEGSIIGTFGLSRDITERKHGHEQVERLAEELHVKNKTLEEDLEMARELQSSMLPQHFPCFPRTASEANSAVRFHHFYKPSMIVSGDFFDVLDISDTAVGIFICDVMGHGVRAALVAAIVRGLLKELKHLWAFPAKLISELNRELFGSLGNRETPIFVSAFYIVADLDKGELRYANAGHPFPLCVHEHRKYTAPHQLNGFKPGSALGLFENERYRECSSNLMARDTILLFTDGLFEVESAKGQSFDYVHLLDAVAKRSDLPTLEMCRGIIDEIQQFSANREFTDDMCLVAIEVARLLPPKVAESSE